MNIRHTKILRDLFVNRSRTFLVICAVAVGVTAFGLMQIGGIVLQENLRESFPASKPANSVMIISPFDKDLVGIVENLDGVENAQGRTVTQALIETAPEKWVSLELHTVDDLSGLKINRISFLDSAIQPARGEILLEGSLRALADIGNNVQIRLLNGDAQTLHVAGFANDLSLIPSPIGLTAYGYISRDTAKMLNLPPEFNHLYVRVKDTSSRAAIEKTITKVVKKAENKGYVVFSAPVPEYNKQLLGDNVDSVLLILNSLGQLVLLLSAFLVTAVMFAVMNQQIKQIGILKSLGGQSSQTMSLYFQQVVLYGLCALIFAIPLSAVGGYFMAGGVADGMNMIVDRFFIPAQTIFLQFGSALLVPLLAALLPIINGSRISIREAISDFNQNDSTQLGLIARILSKFGDLPQLVNLSIRNTFRRPGRLLLNFATLVLAGAMFIAVIGIRQSMRAAIAEIENDTLYDVEVNFTQPYHTEKIIDAASKIDGVRNVETWNISDGRIVFNDDHLSGSIGLLGVPARTEMTHPHAVSGRWLDPNDRFAIFLSADALMLDSNLKPGDKIQLNINGEKHDWVIVGFGTRGFGPLGYVHSDDLEETITSKGTGNRLVVTTDSSEPDFQTQVQKRLLEKMHADNLEVASSTTTTELKISTANQMDTLIILLLVMVILIAVVGGLGLAITMSLNVMERTREIGIMRSLGAQDSTLRRMVITESVLIALLSWLIAIPISIPIGFNLGNALGISLLARPLTYIFSFPALGLWLILVIVIAIISSLFPAANAAKLTIRDALTYE